MTALRTIVRLALRQGSLTLQVRVDVPLLQAVSVSVVSFLGPKTRRRLRGDKKDGDSRHLEQGNKKTSVAVDVVTTSVETGGAGRRAGSGAGQAGAQRLRMAGSTASDVTAHAVVTTRTRSEGGSRRRSLRRILNS